MEISLSCTPSPLDHQFESEIPQFPNQLRNICISVDIKITWSFTRSLWLNNSQNFTADASAIRDFSLPKCSSGWDQPLGCCAGKLARIRGLVLRLEFSVYSLVFICSLIFSPEKGHRNYSAVKKLQHTIFM